MGKTLRGLAYNAIERAMMSDESETETSGTEAFHRWKDRIMSEKELKKWAYDQIEYRSMQ